ncbi:MAG: ABC transporter substrate-binding protein [Candidatus Bathyarchaeia archaeon]
MSPARSAVAVTILVGLLLVSSSIAGSSAQESRGPAADEIEFIHYLDEQVAVKEVQAGNIHTYFWRIPPELAQQLKNDPAVRVYESPGGMVSLLVNPAPVEGAFNPFTLKEVRFALNYLVDREFFVNEILNGFGVPQVAVYGVYDPDYLVVAADVESLGIRYNPELANEMITEALTAAGARKVEGQWMYEGEPITINFFIRSDDPRRKALGDTLAAQLETVGFKVEKNLGDLTKAFSAVYGADPKSGTWHLYTEGWGRSALVKYDTVVIAQMYAPWYSFMPGFGEPTYWNYENEKLDVATKRITTGDFTSKGERDAIIAEATLDGVSEAVRIFVASVIEPYVVNKEMEGVVNDFGAGVTGRWTLINARTTQPGVPLEIGMKQIYQGAWNPVAGNTDYYATRMWYGVYDPAAWTNPHTGEIIPLRTTWTVESAGPEGALTVPGDAMVWDVDRGRWKQVGEGVTAISKGTFDLKLANWHHGELMSKADMLFALYFTFEWGTRQGEADLTFDPEYTQRSEPFVKTLKGFRFLDDDTVEVYVDYWHFDEAFIADYASVWTSLPWEIDAAMEKLVLDNKFAYSRSASRAQNVEWLSLIIKSHASEIKKTLQEFSASNHIPPALEGFVTNEEAQRRYNASIEWIEKRGNALVSNGPFYFVDYNPEARTIRIKAFRDPTYPFEAGIWKNFEIAALPSITNVQVPSLVEIASPATIEVYVEVAGKPTAEVEVTYLLANPEGRVVTQGQASPTTAGVFRITLPTDLTAALTPGPYRLKLFAISPEVVRPDIFEVSFLVIEKATPTPTTPQPTPIPTPTPSPTVTPSPVPEVGPQPSAPLPMEVVFGIIAAVVVVVAGVAVLVRRRAKKT